MTDHVKAEFFPTLEASRGLAALLVVFFHMPAWFPPVYDVPLFRNSYLMVDFFFVLSGFILCHTYQKRIRTGRDLLRFMMLRFGRVYPVHLVFLLAFLAMEVLKYVLQARYAVAHLQSKAFQANDLTAFIEHLFLVQALGLDNRAFTFNVPSWSISTEFYTYLLFGVATLLLSLKRFYAFAICIAVLAFSALLLGANTIGPFLLILKCLAGFFFGVLSFLMYCSVAGRKFSGLWVAASAILLIAFLSLKNQMSLDELMYPFSAFLVFSLVVSPTAILSKFLLLSPLLWLGRVSYSLYMSHSFSLAVINRFCKALSRAPDAIIGGVAVPQLSWAMSLFFYPLATASTLVVAWLTFRWIELPSRAWVRRYVDRHWSVRHSASANKCKI